MKIDKNTGERFDLGHYERHEAIIAVSEMDFNMKNKDNCLNCPEYGKNFSCPPFSPGFNEFIGNLKRAKVICLRTPLHLFDHLPEEKRARTAYDKMSLILTDILIKERNKGHLIAGAGACKACLECPLEKETGLCIKPEEQIFSLESLGINISSLMKRCFQIKLEWSESHHAARHICAVGATFINQ